MATNAFFRNHDNVYEQNLIDDLVIEIGRASCRERV